MFRQRTLAIIGFCLATSIGWLSAESNVKKQRSLTLFQGAQRCFQAGQWSTAAGWFLEFIGNNPNSNMRNEAILYRAQALFRLKQYRECFNELKNAEESSGLFAAKYKFWMAECRYREAEEASENQGLYRVAAQLYAEVPKSDRLVAANVSEAMAYAQLEDWPKVVELLRPAASPFQNYASSSPESSLTLQGRLILAEALLRQGLNLGATDILNQLSELELAEQDRWRRQILLSRALIAKGEYAEALNVLEELLRTSENRMPQLRAAQAFELKLNAHKELGQIDKALEMCRNLWQAGMPIFVRQRGLLLSLDLAVRNGASLNIAEFNLESESLLKNEGLAVAQVALGDFHLARHQTTRIPRVFFGQSNQLDKSKLNYSAAIESMFSGHARTGLAWNLWENHKFGESCTNFIQAVNGFIDSKKRISLQFKAMESAFRFGDMQNTLKIGRDFLSRTSDYTFTESAKFLLVRAAVKEAAEKPRSIAEARQIYSLISQEENPKDFERASILMARAESVGNNPVKARELLKQIPDSSALKQVAALEAARTFVREKKWKSAINQYETWLGNSVDVTANQRARVSFDLGWLYNLNGLPGKAAKIFSNIVVRFPSSPEAARSQMWIADYQFSQKGEVDYVKAEESYQKVRDMPNCPTSLRHRASLMAGRAALARRSYRNAREYFRLIAVDPKCPEAIKVEAKFALSDTAILDDANFDEAITILENIIYSDVGTSSLIILQVHGRIGDCHLQMAAEDPDRYRKAQESYRRVLDLSNRMNNDHPVRYRAMMGMAQSLRDIPEESASKRNENLILALSWAKKVFEGAGSVEANLEPYWVRQSALMSAELQMLANKPREEIATLKALSRQFEKMSPALDSRIGRIRQKLREAGAGKSPENK